MLRRDVISLHTLRHQAYSQGYQEFRGVDQSVVGAQYDPGVALGQGPESAPDRIFKDPGILLSLVASTDIAPNALAIGLGRAQRLRRSNYLWARRQTYLASDLSFARA